MWPRQDCFAGWPLAADADAPGGRHASIALFHTVELGWYLHYLLKTPLGGGPAWEAARRADPACLPCCLPC